MAINTSDNSVWQDCSVCGNHPDRRKTCPKIGCMNGRVLKK